MRVIIRTICGCKREMATSLELGATLRLPCISRRRKYQYSSYDKIDTSSTKLIVRKFRYIGDRDIWGTPILDEIV